MDIAENADVLQCKVIAGGACIRVSLAFRGYKCIRIEYIFLFNITVNIVCRSTYANTPTPSSLRSVLRPAHSVLQRSVALVADFGVCAKSRGVL